MGFSSLAMLNTCAMPDTRTSQRSTQSPAGSSHGARTSGVYTTVGASATAESTGRDDDSDVRTVADQLRAAFTLAIRSRGGGWSAWTPGPRWTTCWEKAAQLCLSHGFEPMLHVRALVERCREPWPNMLVGSRAVDRTRRFLERYATDEMLRPKSQLGYLAGRVGSGFDIVSVLTDPEQDLAPSIRYCFAVHAGFSAIAARYRDATRLELRLNPVRRELIQRMLGVDHWNSFASEAAR